MKASLAHAYLPEHSRPNDGTQKIDTVDCVENLESGHVTDTKMLNAIQMKSDIDLEERYFYHVQTLPPIEERVLKMHPQSMMSKIYQKSFEMRSQKHGALRDQAFVLEEMAKEITNKGQNVTLLDNNG